MLLQHELKKKKERKVSEQLSMFKKKISDIHLHIHERTKIDKYEIVLNYLKKPKRLNWYFTKNRSVCVTKFIFTVRERRKRDQAPSSEDTCIPRHQAVTFFFHIETVAIEAHAYHSS